MNTDMFKEAMSHLASGVCMVTIPHESLFMGVTVSSVISVSLDPCLILFTLKREAAVFNIFAKTSWFSVHILAQDQQELSRKGTQRGGYLFSDKMMASHLLEKALSSLRCEKYNQISAGDHDLILGKVTTIKQGMDKPPLVYCRRSYQSLNIPCLDNRMDEKILPPMPNFLQNPN